MARARRVIAPNAVHHVVNRANRRAVIFHKPGDYSSFLSVLSDAREKFGMRVLAFCLMQNHWHLVLWPDENVSLSAFMHWLTSTHVRRYHAHHGLTGTGHLYQARYRDRLCTNERGVLAVIRYVEANALAAGIVQRAEDWEWSSLAVRLAGDQRKLLTPGPTPLPPNWTTYVNETTAQSRADAIHTADLVQNRPPK